MRYWADHVFAANHWESHCSGAGANVHILGLLLVSLLSQLWHLRGLVSGFQSNHWSQN